MTVQEGAGLGWKALVGFLAYLVQVRRQAPTEGKGVQLEQFLEKPNTALGTAVARGQCVMPFLCLLVSQQGADLTIYSPWVKNLVKQ